MSAVDRQTCRSCVFWDAWAADRDPAHPVEYPMPCRRRAPEPAKDPLTRFAAASWPWTRHSDWCGEHTPRQTAEAPSAPPTIADEPARQAIHAVLLLLRSTYGTMPEPMSRCDAEKILDGAREWIGGPKSDTAYGTSLVARGVPEDVIEAERQRQQVSAELARGESWKGEPNGSMYGDRPEEPRPPPRPIQAPRPPMEPERKP